MVGKVEGFYLRNESYPHLAGARTTLDGRDANISTHGAREGSESGSCDESQMP